MADWLVAHAGSLYATALLGGFGLVAGWETLQPLRPSTQPLGQRWSANLALFLGSQALTRWLMPLSAIAAATMAQQRGWGLLAGWHGHAVATALLCLVLLDAVRWGLHALQHRWPWLWRLHRVHHSDLEFDCTIGLRFHPLEALVVAGVMVAAVVTLGVPPHVVVLSDVLTMAAGFLAHGNVSLPERWHRVLGRLIVTPDFHRVHHSCRREESTSNFGSVLPVWDRLFGTATEAPRDGHLGMQIGLSEMRDASRLSLLSLLCMPFRPLRGGA